MRIIFCLVKSEQKHFHVFNNCRNEVILILSDFVVSLLLLLLDEIIPETSIRISRAYQR